MVLCKGLFPYEYLTSKSVLKETKLLPQEKVYSKLKQSDITDEEYNHALKVFQKAECKNMQDYLELYSTLDVLLLAAIFENFGRASMASFKLDPAYFLTISSLSMQAALKNCKNGVELIYDISVYTEIETYIIGGFTSVIRGRVTFNNEHVSAYDPKKNDRCITRC